MIWEILEAAGPQVMLRQWTCEVIVMLSIPSQIVGERAIIWDV